MRKKIKKHWYFISSSYCPLCGSSSECRERRFDPRPEEWNDRHEYLEIYDQCNYY